MLCLLGLSLWEAVLLLPTWPRRLVWTFTFLLASITSGFIDSFEIQDWYYPIWFAALFQTLILVGVRNRAWIWLLGVIAADAVGWWGRGYVFEVYWQAYQDLGRVVNENYLLSYGNAYEMLHHIAFGAIAAFMPPVGDPTGEQSR
jgi:hypothetical protein